MHGVKYTTIWVLSSKWDNYDFVPPFQWCDFGYTESYDGVNWYAPMSDVPYTENFRQKGAR